MANSKATKKLENAQAVPTAARFAATIMTLMLFQGSGCLRPGVRRAY